MFENSLKIFFALFFFFELSTIPINCTKYNLYIKFVVVVVGAVDMWISRFNLCGH